MQGQLFFLFTVLAVTRVVAGTSLVLSDITVEGVIYCKCNMTGYNAKVDGSPLSGVIVGVKCDIDNYQYHVSVNATTDNFGYFRVSTKMDKNHVGHDCEVYVVSSPLSKCCVPPKLATPGTGPQLIYEKEEPGSGSLYYSWGLNLIGSATSSACHDN